MVIQVKSVAIQRESGLLSFMVSSQVICIGFVCTYNRPCRRHQARKESHVARNIDAKPSREMKQPAEEDGSGSHGSTDPIILGGKTQLPPSGSSSNRNALGKREREIVRLLAEGKSNKEIAPLMNITVKTVETYRSRVMWKLDIHSVAHLIRYAVQNKLVDF